MVETTQWLLWEDRVKAAATTIVASSAQNTAPVSYLRDELRSKVWRTQLGWTFTLGFNDRLQVDRGGVQTAVITGTYATGALAAAALQAALEAADPTPVWAVSYNVGTHKFTVASDLSFAIVGGGTRSVLADLGFADANTSSGTSFTGTGEAYQSRHGATFDLGSAMSVQSAVLLNHNLSASGTAALYGASSPFSSAADLGAVQLALIGDTAVRFGALGAPVSYRYWELQVNDVANSDGFLETKLLFGPYDEMSYPFQTGFGRGGVDYSSVAVAEQGAQHRNARARGITIDASWKALTDYDLTRLDALEGDRGVGGCFVLVLFAGSAAPYKQLLYGSLAAPLSIVHDNPDINNVGMKFIESLA